MVVVPVGVQLQASIFFDDMVLGVMRMKTRGGVKQGQDFVTANGMDLLL